MFKKLPNFFVILFFIFTGLIYFHNLTRDIYGGDIGDLVTAAYTFGVAHPPGYPLFSFIGYLFSQLPINLPVVTKVGLISVISSLFGLIFFYKFSLKITKSIFLSLLSTSILGFSYFYWLTAEIPEGLALNNFFLIMILYFSINFYNKVNSRSLYLLFLFIGLSMTHQFYIFTVFPAIFLLIVNNWRFILSKKRFIFSFLFLILGLSIYIYIPIAASRNPPINWDNAVNLNNFLHLILRKDYGGIFHTVNEVPFVVRLVFLKHYLESLVSVFSWQVIFVLILGFYNIFKKDKKLSLYLFLAFFISGVITFYITAAPIYTAVSWGVGERYYSVSMIVLMFFLPYGFIQIKKVLKKFLKKYSLVYIILSLFIFIPVLMIKYNFPKTDLSNTTIGNDLARNILNPLPKNSILFVYGDNVTFSVWYSYYVLKLRPDIDLVNPAYVGNNFLTNVLNDYYNKNPETKLDQLFQKTFEQISKNRRVFTANLTAATNNKNELIPFGLTLEIVGLNETPNEKSFLQNTESIWQNIKIKKRNDLQLSEQNFIVSEMPTFYSNGQIKIGTYLINKYKNYEKAAGFFKKAISIDETNSLAYFHYARSLIVLGNCSEAIKNIDKAIELYPVWKDYYAQQYYVYEKCGIDKTKLEKIKQDFKKTFKSDIDELLPKKENPVD